MKEEDLFKKLLAQMFTLKKPYDIINL